MREQFGLVVGKDDNRKLRPERVKCLMWRSLRCAPQVLPCLQWGSLGGIFLFFKFLYFNDRGTQNSFIFLFHIISFCIVVHGCIMLTTGSQSTVCDNV